MNTATRIIACGTFAATRQPHPAKRGDLDYPITATDLIEFGRSPLRWVRSAPSTLDGFTPVYLEPWMTQGTSPTASFFAIGATPGGVPA